MFEFSCYLCRHNISERPRYVLGIKDETYEYAAKYCEDYKYPRTLPLCLSVDDTKLFGTLQPLYDGPKKTWFLVGVLGADQIQIPDIDCLENILQEKRKPAEKLRLWTLQIPLPGIPPLALAMLPISSKIRADDLADYQIQLAQGLILHKFRFISNASDGAAVERTCQRLLADAGRTQLHRIRSPVDGFPDLCVPLHNLDGNTFVTIQDACHGRKTGRNNIFTGVRGLILGNFVVYYEQLHAIAMQDNTPLYERDVIRSDRQDDNAASRTFSAATLNMATLDPEHNMRLCIMLFSIGELIDAYESRTLMHLDRCKIAVRLLLFFQTWKHFLRKQGYAEHRHYISREADDIFRTLSNGLLGLILIHRDHLTSSVPLLPWKHASMANEHMFSALRDYSKDLTLVEAIVASPHLRATMLASSRARFAKAGFKAVASGYQHHDLPDDHSINFGAMKTFPTDAQLTGAYKDAIEENEALWALLGVHLEALNEAPDISLKSSPVDVSLSTELSRNDEDDETICNMGIHDDLQDAIDAVTTATNLTKGEDKEFDACVAAAAALVIENLTAMYVVNTVYCLFIDHFIVIISLRLKIQKIWPNAKEILPLQYKQTLW